MIKRMCVFLGLSLLFLNSILARASSRLEQIILSSPSDHVVIQLASYPEDIDFNKALKELRYDKKLVAIKTIVKGKNRWILLEGVYKDQIEANGSIALIKKRFPRIKPWARSIASLKRVLAIETVNHKSD